MCPYRIEITQYTGSPGARGPLQGGDHVLADQFGMTVGTGVAARAVLCDWQFAGVAIDGRAARKNQGLASALLHGFEQAEHAAEVVAVILQRLLDAFAHCFEPGKVHHRLHTLLLD